MKERKKIIYPIASIVLTVPFIACSGQQESGICASFQWESSNTIQSHNRPDQFAYDNFVPINKDSKNSEDFKQFIGNSKCLIEAWTVESSIYSNWYKIELLEAVDYAPEWFLPRFMKREERSNDRLTNFIPDIVNDFGKNSTAFILNSGGQHSVSMAHLLAKNGWQPVPMITGENIPCHNCDLSAADQSLAVALYSASEMMKVTKGLPYNSPPVFIWDFHRSSKTHAQDGIKNGYEYDLEDMPNPQFLLEEGIVNVIYIDEVGYPQISSFNPNLINPVYIKKDTKAILENYLQNGLKVYTLGISPNP